MVNIVVSWELCWYRYEVDLSDEVPAVRAAAQGYELTELSRDRAPEQRAEPMTAGAELWMKAAWASCSRASGLNVRCS